MSETVVYCRRLPAKLLIDKKYLEEIHKLVKITSCIIRETYQFIKAYALFQLENDLPLETIDRSFIKQVFRLISNVSKRGKQPKIPDSLRNFYDNFYVSKQLERFDAPNKDLLNAEIVQMITAINNHIKGNLYLYIRRLASVHFPTPSKKKKEECKIEEKKSDNEEKTNNEEETKDDDYKKNRNRLIKELWNYVEEKQINNSKKKNKKNDDDEKWDIITRLVDSFGPLVKEAKRYRYKTPQLSLPTLFKINRVVQAMNGKTFALLPLRSSLIPGSISLSKTICDGLGMSDLWEDIQHQLPRRRITPKDGFKFSSLRTDGVSCSLYFTSEIKREETPPEKYVDDLDENELDDIQALNIVAADPNKGNLLQMEGPDGVRLRYTQNQRRKESGANNYRKCRIRREENTFASVKSDNPYIISLKTNLLILRCFNSRTTNWEEFLNFVSEKNKFVFRFRSQFEKFWYRKFRFNQKINEQRSRDQFLNRFAETYGRPDQTVLCIGDWEQSYGISFGKEPTMGRGIRNWFRHRGYRVYLVDEFRTSKTCCKCHGENEYNWTKRKDPRPWKLGKKQDVWGLTRCKNSQCRTVNARDVNSASNIRLLANCAIKGWDKPVCFQR